MNYKIDKNIPIPSRTRSLAQIGKADTLRKMKEGDSIFVEPDSPHSRQSWRTVASYIGFKIITRKEGEGFRLWHAGKKGGK